MVAGRPLDRLLEGVPGFGDCIVGRCRYVDRGSAAICSACAQRSLTPLAPHDRRCPICDQPFDDAALRCGNSMCNDPDRQFEWNYAVAMKDGPLERAIWAYKAGLNQAVWASIFARVFVGFLQQRATGFREFDLIVASPTWVGQGSRTFDHTREIIAAADREAPGWPFDIEDPPAIVRTAKVPSMRSTTSLVGRRAIAQGPLRAALKVPRPDRVADRSILVFDDVFTDGQTLNEVARCLLGAGAKEVCGVTLARQPWRPRPTVTPTISFD